MKRPKYEALLVRAGALLDEMQHARYHGPGAFGKDGSERWGRVRMLSEEIDAALGSRAASPFRRRWEMWDAARELARKGVLNAR